MLQYEIRMLIGAPGSCDRLLSKTFRNLEKIVSLRLPVICAAQAAARADLSPAPFFELVTVCGHSGF